MDLRPASPEEIRRRLENGLRNKNPRSTLASALAHKKTLRLGNRVDPYQPAEIEHKVSRQVQFILVDLNWTYVIQTRFLHILKRDEDIMRKALKRKLIHIMPVISPGAEGDWELFERKRTTPIPHRLKFIRRWVNKGFPVGVNGEPFIPGYHTPKQFRDILRRLKEVGVNSYNVYNLHFNDHVAKRLHEIGLDIERIWHYNQDKQWKPILSRLLEIARQEDILLGCPDFVNSGWEWVEGANTCCGINVPNPSRYNSHHWKQMIQEGKEPEEILEKTWEGIGDRKAGQDIVRGNPGEFYTMDDIK